MSEWRETKIGKLTTKIGSGATPRGGSNAYLNEGISLIRSQNVLDLMFSVNGLAFIDENQAKALNNVTIEKDDILLNITGDSVARVCKVPDFVLPARVNQHVAIIRADQSKLDSDFLLYYLISQKEELLSQSEIGATRKAITKGMIEQLKITLPELSEQKVIATILSSLDNKIDLLHRQNKTIEQMAETLFRQWFVEEAKEDWEVKALKQVVDIGIGRTPPRKEFQWFSKSNADVKWVSIKDLANSGLFVFDTTEYLTDEAVEKFNIPIIPADTVLLSFKMTLGRLAITTEPMLSNEAIAHFRFNENTPFSKEYLYFYLKTYPYETLGSTSSIVTAINSGMIKDLEITIPDKETLMNYESIVVDLFNKINSNQRQIRNLTDLRDTLLPKLMSGEVTISTDE